MRPYRHLSDLRTTLLLRARISTAGSDVLCKAEALASSLAEARRLLVEHEKGAQLQEVLAQARDMLDELDERVLVLAHNEDRPVFSQLALLRGTLDDLDRRRANARGARLPAAGALANAE